MYMAIHKDFYSTSEIAQLLGVSRIAIFKKIKSGQIKAEKIGRNYVVPKNEVQSIVGRFVPADRQRELNEGVKRVVEEYGEALRRLGKE
jgi:excisionase family DNA binding protein